MSKFVSAPTQWMIYKVPDETFVMYGPQTFQLPPAIVLEMMVANGHAERIGIVGGIVPGEEDEVAEISETTQDEPTEEQGTPEDGLWYAGKQDGN